MEELLVFPAGQPPHPCCQLVLAPLPSVGVGQSYPVSCCPCGQEWACGCVDSVGGDSGGPGLGADTLHTINSMEALPAFS